MRARASRPRAVFTPTIQQIVKKVTMMAQSTIVRNLARKAALLRKGHREFGLGVG
jgi:hypothetical protein